MSKLNLQPPRSCHVLAFPSQRSSLFRAKICGVICPKLPHNKTWHPLPMTPESVSLSRLLLGPHGGPPLPQPAMRASAPHLESTFKALGHLTFYLKTLLCLPPHSVQKPEALKVLKTPPHQPPAHTSVPASSASLLWFKDTRLPSVSGTLHMLFPLPQGLCTCSLSHISMWLIASAPRVRQPSPTTRFKAVSLPHIPPCPSSSPALYITLTTP